jgi:hypothetical protein
VEALERALEGQNLEEKVNERIRIRIDRKGRIRIRISVNSVADPGCLSRIPDPDFYPSRIPDPESRIPDPKTAMKDRGEKKFVVITFLCRRKFHKIKLFYF